MSQIGHQRDGGGGNGGPASGPTTPVGQIGTAPPGQSSIANTTAAQARPLPICWGTSKVSANLIEKKPATTTQPFAWQITNNYSPGAIVASHGNAYLCVVGGTSGAGSGPSGAGGNPVAWVGSAHAYVVNDTVASSGNAYRCTIAGASGSAGPFGTGVDLIDNPFGGGQPHWTYMQALPCPLVYGDGACVWQYLQQLPYPLYSQQFVAALCEGEIVGAKSLFWDKERVVGPSATSPGKMLAIGTGPDALGQTLGGTFDSSGYQHVAVIYPIDQSAGIYTGTQAQIPNIAVEVQGQMFGATTDDPSPADIVNDLLTHSRRGAGISASRVDASVTGTATNGFRVYCDAAGFRFSILLDSSRYALALLGDILVATNCDAVWSGGAIKIVPLGDQAIASPVYGSTGYVPTNTAVYALGVDDFLDQHQPVQVRRKDDVDCFNDFPVEYSDRKMGYSRVTVDDPDMADVEKRGGLLRASTVALPMAFPDGTYPLMLSRILAQRSLYIRNTYTFRLPWRYILLEPTDVVTLTEPGIGLVALPVRITELSEQSDGTLQIIAEDYPAGVQAANAYTPQKGDGYTPNELSTTAQLATAIGHANLTNRNSDNLFPNPTSEISPPPNVVVNNDGNNAEWDCRKNIGLGVAPAGLWVRHVTAVSAVRVRVSCLVGETYYFEAQTRALGPVLNAYIGIRFLDSAGALLLDTGASPNLTTAWVFQSFSVDVFAGACFAEAYLNASGSQNNEFDQMLFKRIVNTGIIRPGAAGQLMSTSASGATQWGPPPAPAWTALTLAGAWVSDAFYSEAVPGYLKDAVGMVHLRGGVSGGAGVIATLPVGYRPASQIILAAPAHAAFGMVAINNAGVISNVAGATNSLDGLTFLAEL